MILSRAVVRRAAAPRALPLRFSSSSSASGRVAGARAAASERLGAASSAVRSAVDAINQ
jgi:hypothetical protein